MTTVIAAERTVAPAKRLRATAERLAGLKAKKPTTTKPILTRSDRIAIIVAVCTAVSTVLLSMLLNVWAFTANNPSYFGVLIGILLPLWTLALTFMGQHFHHINKYVSCGSYALAVFVLVVSIPHLANGYSLLGDQANGNHMFQGWCLAIVTDIAQLLCKIGCIHIAKHGKV